MTSETMEQPLITEEEAMKAIRHNLVAAYEQACASYETSRIAKITGIEAPLATSTKGLFFANEEVATYYAETISKIFSSFGYDIKAVVTEPPAHLRGMLLTVQTAENAPRSITLEVSQPLDGIHVPPPSVKDFAETVQEEPYLISPPQRDGGPIDLSYLVPFANHPQTWTGKVSKIGQERPQEAALA